MQIKGTRNGLLILVDKPASFDDIKNNLLHKLETAKGFFRGAKFILKHNDTIPAEQHRELENILSSYGLIPISGFTPKRPVSQLPPSGETTMLVRHNLRSGQTVCNPNGHVVLLGDIHSGAQVWAKGNVVIFGRCEGQIHAGIYGDTTARVVCSETIRAAVTIAGQACPPATCSQNNKPLTVTFKANKIS